MGCVQSRDSPRSAGSGSGGDSERSERSGPGVAGPPDAAFLAEVHRRRVEANNPGAAHLDHQDALGRYEAAADARGVAKPFNYRQWDTKALREATAALKGGHH
jgi:hypothetical protein